jgi:hypothetical protein
VAPTIKIAGPATDHWKDPPAMTATAPSQEYGRAQKSPYARPEAPVAKKRREYRLDKSAAWMGGLALGCAVVPMLRWAAIGFGTASLLMGITSLGTPKRKGQRRDTAWIAIALSILAAFGMVASQTVFGAVHSKKPAPVNTAPIEVVQAATTEQVLRSQAKVDIGKVYGELDPSGVTMTSLPVALTNISGKTLSYDIEIVAIDAKGKVITHDSAFIPSLENGQTANVRVMNLLGDDMAAKLATATFQVVKASSY